MGLVWPIRSSLTLMRYVMVVYPWIVMVVYPWIIKIRCPRMVEIRCPRIVEIGCTSWNWIRIWLDSASVKFRRFITVPHMIADTVIH